MKRPGLLVRLRARVHADERGFTLIETIIAVTIIFGSLLTVAYAATIGFGYEDLARQKQTATGIADQIMEQVRGLPWDSITAGHVASDLSTSDTNLKTGCAGDAAGVYRFKSCTATASVPGSGEKLVAQATACAISNPKYPKCVFPLVLHSGTIIQHNITYTWRTYDTNNCPTYTSCTAVVNGVTTALPANPYRLTVIVTWSGGKAAPNKIVQVQSLFWSPSGCRSTATHPFAAPCQPFFFGTSTVGQGNINITGTISGTTFESGDVFTSGVQASVQQEQLSQAEGTFNQSGVQLVDSSGAQTAAGDTAASSAADTDPGTGSGSWAQAKCGTTVVCPGGSVATGSSNSIRLTAPSGESAETDSTVSAGGSNVCPPPTDTAQNDGKPCSGSRIQQGGTLSAILTLNGLATALGDATLAQVQAAASNPNKTFVDRVAYNIYNTPPLCSPVTGSDGCIEDTTTRAIGTVSIGGVPSAITMPSPWNGSYFSITGYRDTATAAVGTNLLGGATCSGSTCVPAPTASITAGTVSCWNGGTGSGYNTVSFGSMTTTAVTCAPFDLSWTVNGHLVRIQMTGTTSPAVITKSPTTSGTSQTDVTAQITPPTAAITYVVSVDSTQVVNLTITVNLNTLEARGSYAAAPTTNS